jgi:hypothetical protein
MYTDLKELEFLEIHVQTLDLTINKLRELV